MLQYTKILTEFKNVLLKQEGATWTNFLNARPQQFIFHYGIWMQAKDSRFLDHLTPSQNWACIYTHTQILIKMYRQNKALDKKILIYKLSKRTISLATDLHSGSTQDLQGNFHRRQETFTIITKMLPEGGHRNSIYNPCEERYLPRIGACLSLYLV